MERPTSADYELAGQPEDPSPQGFADNMVAFLRIRAIQRIARYEAWIEEEERQLRLERVRAQIAALEAQPEEADSIDVTRTSRQTSGSRCVPAIESQIGGEFEGWDGDTVFVLTNGQVWQQSRYAYTYHYAYRPEVLIYPSDAGTCELRVDGISETISVQRIR